MRAAEVGMNRSSMDSLYKKDGKTLGFKVSDPKVPLAELTMPGR
jgi:hypothetical protein